MNPILRSLQDIKTGYSVFEKDQVLTHEQLNSVADYCDDQDRLTRTKLLGVGIACGLRLSMANDVVTVTKGVGITTDGDLLYLSSDTVFDKFKLYDDSNPKYDPFYSGDKMNTVYQLLAQGTAETDAEAKSLSSFATDTGASLDNMVGVLFMEGYVKDQDVCSGTDCDNLGQDFVNTTKLLLVDKGSLGALQKSVPTPRQAASALSEIVADRALLSSSIATAAQLAAVYRTATNSIEGKLVAELPKVYQNGAAFLGDVFSSDPSDGWVAKLNGVNTAFAASDSGIQYYYDFLKDVVATYNDLRGLLLTSDPVWCCPEIDGFPKHLLLGNLVPAVAAAVPPAPRPVVSGGFTFPAVDVGGIRPAPGSILTRSVLAAAPVSPASTTTPVSAVPTTPTEPDENRTGFYPSPVAARSVETLDRVQFLARKLDTLIQTFQAPVPVSTVRVTPSVGEESGLEERAIPYYYQVNTTNPIQKAWNYRLHQQGMDASNYSYNASAYGAQGAAASPFTAQLGRFSFFRVEGHLGQDVSAARTDIEAQIKSGNLPFTIQTVFLGSDKTKVVKKPGFVFGDLHRLHHVLRTDLSDQLDNATKFSDFYSKQVNTGLSSDDVGDIELTKQVATEKNAALTTAVNDAQGALKQRYSAYRTNTAWTPAVGVATTTAAAFKQNLGSVTQTSFNTAFDTLVSSSHANLLNWLDVHIQDKSDKEDEKLLFSNFQSIHPGMEHFAGVVRGGTFVMAYDSNNKVVADFMLPYYCPEPVREEDPSEPTLPLPPTLTALPPDKRNIVLTSGIDLSVTSGIKLAPSLDNFVSSKLDAFKDKEVTPVVNTQSGLMNTLLGNFAGGSTIKLASTSSTGATVDKQ